MTYLSSPDNYELLTETIKVDSLGDFTLLDYLRKSRLQNVHEIGCGSGFLTDKISRIKGIKLSASDYKNEWLEFTKNRIKNIPLFILDATKDRLNEKVDLLCARFVYHHICNDKKVNFLRNLKESINSGGKILILDYFLPENSNQNLAIKKFYDYRLKLAKNNLLWSKLEKESLNLSLSGKEEFKVPLSTFYKHLSSVGLDIEEHRLITSSQINNPDLFGLHLFVLGGKVK